MKPLQVDETFPASMTRNAYLERTKDVLESLGAKVALTQEGLTARGGSRLALKLGGVYLYPERLPWVATIEVAELSPGEISVQITACSDEGFMIWRVRRLTETYDTRLNTVVVAAKQAAS